MTTANESSSGAQAVELLREFALSFGSKSEQIFELRIQLKTPGVFTPAKADILIPGLPTLDGFLSFVAFRMALETALTERPDLATDLLWQWNLALRDSTLWIDFPLPLNLLQFGTVQVFESSVGLPVDNSDPLIPAGAFFARGRNLETYPKVTDSVALRRRVTPPYHRPLDLAHRLQTGSGPTKQLDNRMYFSLTTEYLFYFRGDADGVAQMLEFAYKHRIGIGKKTTLGYGQIAGFAIQKSTTESMLVQPVPGRNEYALVKTLPYESVMELRTRPNPLFGSLNFRVVNPLETFGPYRPPYWLRDRQTPVLSYGTLLLPR